MDSNTQHKTIDHGASGQVLTFMVAGEEYGIEILKVQEIKGWDRTTPIPNTPPHVLGVLNLRGAVVPIVDLRRQFGLAVVEPGPTSVVIVVKAASEDRERTVGLAVDAVADVVRLSSEEVQDAPQMGSGNQGDFINGLGTVDDRMVILLDVDRLIQFDHLPEAGAPKQNFDINEAAAAPAS